MPTRAHHVAFVVTNYPPRSGGVEVHVQSVAHGLLALGMSATVVCLGDDPGVRDDDGVTVHTLRRRLDVSGVLAAPHPGDWRRVTREVLPEASWLSVHTRFFPMTWFGVGAGRRLGLPVLLTEHGSGFVHTGSAAVDAAARLVDHTAGRWALRRATTVVSVSDEVSGFVARLSGRSASVVGNGVHLDRWRARPGEAIDPVPRLVFVGRLVEEKGWREFLDVAAELARTRPGLRAVVAGDGPQRGAVEAAVADRGLRGVVDILGRVSQPELAPLLRGAVLVNPTRASEGFQLTLPEALAAGGRVVTYAVAGVGPMVQTGLPVRVVAGADPVALAAAAAAELDHPRPAASTEALAPWDWSQVTARYAQVLKDGPR